MDLDIITGSAVAAGMKEAATTKDVDELARTFMKADAIPDYIAVADWPWVVVRENGHELKFPVAPDYGAFGNDKDSWRIAGESQKFAQSYVEKFDSIMPSQKMLRAIQAQAAVKIPYIAVQKGGRADDSPEGRNRANDLANEAFRKFGVTNTDGKLKIGYRKAYVVRPDLDGNWIAIYGGRWAASGTIVQPTSGHAHDANYSDYSHGIVLVSRKAFLDGARVDLRDDVFLSKDPSIYGLVSDEGRFDPVFPNAGMGSIAKAARDAFGGGGSTTTKDSSGDAGASKGGGTIVGAFLGLAAGMALSLNPIPVIVGGAVGAIIGRIVGARVTPTT